MIHSKQQTLRNAPPVPAPSDAMDVLNEIAAAGKAARRALLAIHGQADEDRKLAYLAEMSYLALKARSWKEAGYSLPRQLVVLARRFG